METVVKEENGFNISQKGLFANTTTSILEDSCGNISRSISHKKFQVMGEVFEYKTEAWQGYFDDTTFIVVLVVSLPQNYHQKML